MALFTTGKDAKPQDLHFSSRADAFMYMLSRLVERGVDPMEAATRANEFAEIFAKNLGIPATIEPEPKGVDKYLSMATKVADYIEQHPKVVEYGVPAITFIAGLFTGKKVEQIAQQPSVHEQQPPIDFDKIPD